MAMLAILLNRAWGYLCVESDYVIIDTAPLTVSNDAIVFGMDQRHCSRYRPRLVPKEES